MASYHLAVKTVSRSAGRSATAAAAYRAGVVITDERTGVIHDYTRKQGIVHSEIVVPPGCPEWAHDRGALWNAAERAETRKNSTVAREFEIALPSEIDADQRRTLALALAGEVSARHGVAVDLSIHEPGREGDNRNHHMHMLMTTRRLTKDGLGEKSRELDERKSGEVEHWRARWGAMQNVALEHAGSDERVDHRSFARQGTDAEPEIKQGPAVTAMERRGARQAVRAGKTPEPVTAVGMFNAVIRERRGLRQIIDRGGQWLRDHGIDLDRIKQSAGERIQALRDRLTGPTQGQAGGPAGEQAQGPRVSPTAARLRAAIEETPERVRKIERDRNRSRGGPER